MCFKGYIYASCENPKTEEFELTCPLDGNKFETFIVPPSHIKELSHPAINKLLDEAALEIRKSKKIVFIGYSFPEADIHIKALLKKNLPQNITIHVVDVTSQVIGTTSFPDIRDHHFHDLILY